MTEIETGVYTIEWNPEFSSVSSRYKFRENGFDCVSVFDDGSVYLGVMDWATSIGVSIEDLRKLVQEYDEWKDEKLVLDNYNKA